MRDISDIIDSTDSSVWVSVWVGKENGKKSSKVYINGWNMATKKYGFVLVKFSACTTKYKNVVQW